MSIEVLRALSIVIVLMFGFGCFFLGYWNGVTKNKKSKETEKGVSVK